MSVTGVIQAGGKSTRMGGRTKALMELGGRRIIDRVVDVMRAVTDDLLIVTNTSEVYACLGLPMIADVFPDHGSLGGIFSGLRAASRDSIFTVACDMPFLMPDVARLVTDRAALADVIVPVVGGRYETLHACYAKSCLGPMEAKLRAGHLKIAGFFDDVRVLTIAEDEVARFRSPDLVFMNVNTPDEMAEARERLAALDDNSTTPVPERRVEIR
jgi:molybdenum cofactor guanylyltransferase